MKAANMLKFTQSKELLQQLLETKNAMLCYVSPDNFWYSCPPNMILYRGIGTNKKGENRLGYLLCKVRARLTEDEFPSEESGEHSEIEYKAMYRLSQTAKQNLFSGKF